MDGSPQKWLDELSEDEYAALRAHQKKVWEQLSQLALADGSPCVLSLDYTVGHGLFGRLVDKGGPWDSMNSNINDTNFPVTGSGVVAVRFRTVPGDKITSYDHWVWRDVAKAKFRQMGMRFPNAAETSLFLAENRQVGRGGYPLVAFLQDWPQAFVVDGNSRGRTLGLYDRDYWHPDRGFLGVCE